MLRQLPNLLTLSRILVIPLLAASFMLEAPLGSRVAAGLFLVAGLTDFFDGMLARALHAQSAIGRFLDPIADKLLVAASILMLVYAGRAEIIPALAIICREILVSGLREFLAEINISVPVSKLAKIKTAVQMAAIFLLLLGDVGSALPYTEMVGNYALWAAALLTLITGYTYLRAGLTHMQQQDERRQG